MKREPSCAADAMQTTRVQRGRAVRAEGHVTLCIPRGVCMLSTSTTSTVDADDTMLPILHEVSVSFFDFGYFKITRKLNYFSGKTVYRVVYECFAR